MNPVLMGGVALLSAFGALVVLGWLVHTKRRMQRAARHAGWWLTDTLSWLFATLLCAGAIFGAQWFLLHNTSSPGVWAGVLGLPALAAGAQTARLLADRYGWWW